MENKLIFLSLILSLWSCAQKAVAPSAEIPPTAVIAETHPVATALTEKKFYYSFEELQNAANYTTVVFSQRVNAQIDHKKVRPVFKCDPTDDEINVWSMQLKSLIDEESVSVERDILNNKSYGEKFASCEKTCMCGSYASVLQNFNPSQLNKTQLFQLSDMDRKQKALTANQMLVCAKEFKNFCGSPLHKHLLKMSHQ